MLIFEEGTALAIKTRKAKTLAVEGFGRTEQQKTRED